MKVWCVLTVSFGEIDADCLVYTTKAAALEGTLGELDDGYDDVPTTDHGASVCAALDKDGKYEDDDGAIYLYETQVQTGTVLR